ncbi:WG repeat-containing protein [Clostridium tertium]|uniref:WG repeat-containing protein n=1 Tax=Clostridium tertium TaxID=1559 RepID=UPI0024B3C0B4|nr:WG repeat-containing protein [Clostridium tertium]MDI9215444.1 WG repeat-containing protein [Clostridium tertium]
MSRGKNNKQSKKKNTKKREFGLYPALKNTVDGDRYGYINKEGKEVIPFKFTRAYDFNELGLAIIKENSKFGIIDMKGNYYVNPQFDNINQYKEGRAIYAEKSKMGVLDEKGNKLRDIVYDYIGNYNDGHAVVAKRNGKSYKYGYIDLDAKEITEVKYMNASDFNDGFGLIKIKEREYALIDKQGNISNTYNFEYVGSYGEDLMVFSILLGGPYGYINRDGEIVISPIYCDAQEFNDGVAVVSRGNNISCTHGVIDKLGKQIYGDIYSDVKYLGEGKVALGLPIGDNRIFPRSIYAIGDTKGTLLTKFNYLEIDSYIKGLSYGSDDKKTFFLDEYGKIIKNLPIVDGSGQLRVKGEIIYANIDYFPYYLDKNNKVIYQPNKEIPLDQRYLIIIDKYKPNINYLIYIPQVKGMHDDNIEKEVNSRLREMSFFIPSKRELIGKELNIINDQVLSYNYYGNFQILFYRDNSIIIDLLGYYYPLGEVHGTPIRKTCAIDLLTGKFYNLKDLFKSNTSWINRLNDIIENFIENDPNYEYVFPDSFKGISENHDFYLDKDNLYIYYLPNEIGPYSAGVITFKIPLIQIQIYLDNQGDFYKAFYG